jgi:DnaJ-class molecular chaperone
MVVSFSHYELLGVEQDATEGDIKKAVHKLSLALHPDKNAYGQLLMKQINNAKGILLDPVQRARYDNGELLDHKHERNNSRGNRHDASYHEVRKLQNLDSSYQQQLSDAHRSIFELKKELDDTARLQSYRDRRHEKEVNDLLRENRQLQQENRQYVHRIKKYEVNIDSLTRELRGLKAKSNKKIEDVKKSLALRSVCYRCDGKSTSAHDCTVCQGSGAVQGLWTKCHRCNGTGLHSSINGANVGCTVCSSKGAAAGVLSMICFNCRGNANDCTICYKGKIRGFNLKLCPWCNGKDASKCENCLGKSFVSCQCGILCRGHWFYNGNDNTGNVAAPSSLQQKLFSM